MTEVACEGTITVGYHSPRKNPKMTVKSTPYDHEVPTSSEALYYQDNGSVWTGRMGHGVMVDVVDFTYRTTRIQLVLLPHAVNTSKLSKALTLESVDVSDVRLADWDPHEGFVVVLTFPVPPVDKTRTWTFRHNGGIKPTPLNVKVRIRRPG